MSTAYGFSSTNSGVLKASSAPLVIVLSLMGSATDIQLRDPLQVQVISSGRSTNSGVALTQVAKAVEVTEDSAIRTLRTISGLTWEQLASVFNCSRRALHLWDSGKAIAAANLDKLNRTLDAIKTIDSGSPSENRKFLMTGINGKFPIDLLKEERFADFKLLKEFAHKFSHPVVSSRSQQMVDTTPFESVLVSKSDKVHQDISTIKRVKPRKIET